MARPVQDGARFLGRVLDTNTQTFEGIPVEVAQRIEDHAELTLGQLGQGVAVLDMVEEAKRSTT